MTQWGKLAALYAALVTIWLLAYLSASLLNFLGSYASLWFLPAGVTLAMTMTVPIRYVSAPLVANLALAVPQICETLGVPFTNVRDPLIHAIRLFVIYGGTGLLLRWVCQVHLPDTRLYDALIVVGITMLAALIGATSGISLHVTLGNFPITVAQDIFVPWFVGDAIGALIVPPLLGPILLRWFASDTQNHTLPTSKDVVTQIATIPAILYVVFGFPLTSAFFGHFWYLILLPPLFFAMIGGSKSAALATTLTTFLAPLAAHYARFEGEVVELQFLILFIAVVSLVLGSAISDQRRAFAEVKASEAKLEQQVNDRTKELLDAYKFQQHLIRSIGHDLRQPVQSMSLLLEGVTQLLKDSPVLPHLENAKKLGNTTSDFVDRVLDYAKRDAAKIEASIELVPLSDVFEMLQATFAPEAEAAGVELSFSGNKIELETDGLLLWEALSNLAQNALRLSQRGQRIEVFASSTDETINIGVKDYISPKASSCGEAGFGMLIVNQLAKLLGCEFVAGENCRFLRFTVCETSQN